MRRESSSVSDVTTANRIKLLRWRSRLTQTELGILVRLDATIVSRHENGKRGLSSEHIVRYAAVFKCQTHELFLETSDFGQAWSDERCTG